MAGSTYSTNLKIELMATGENSGTWGDITNTNMGTALEQAIVGYGNPDYVSDANLTISITNSNAAQAARALVLNVTSTFGSLTATRELVVPTIQKQYIVQNNTTGGQSITVKTSAGTGITVPNGRKAHLYVDGTNVIQMFDFVNILGGTIDNTTIGATTASSGKFTTLNASGATTLDGNVALGNASGDLITVPGTINSNLLFTDNTYDIGASGATRPRNLYLAGAATIGGNLSVGGTLTLTGGVNLNGNVTVGDSSADTLTINSTITSNLIFTDNTYDIGASGATRPRNLFLAGNITAGGNQTLTGSLTVDSTTDSSSTTTGSIQTDGGVGIAKSLYVGGNTTLGDASTDTVRVNGYVGQGGAAVASTSYYINGTAASSGTNSFGFNYNASAPTSTTNAFYAFTAGMAADASATISTATAYNVTNLTKGSGASVTDFHGLYVSDLSAGTNNYAVRSTISSGTNKWNIYASGTAQNYFAGNVGINTTTPSYLLDVQTSLTGTSAGDNTVLYVGSKASGRDANIRFGDSVNATARIGYLSGDMYFYVNGSERVRVNTSGQLIVGSTTGYEALNVWGNATIINSSYKGSSTGNYLTFRAGGDSGERSIPVAAIRGVDQYGASGATGYSGSLLFYYETNNVLTEGARLNYLGRFGIGVTVPLAPLHVYGNGTVSTSDFYGTTFTGRLQAASGNSVAASLALMGTGPTGAPAGVSISAVTSSASDNYRASMISTITGDGSGASYWAVKNFNPTTSSTSDLVRLSYTGNFYLGVTSATNTTYDPKMQVNGTICAGYGSDATNGVTAIATTYAFGGLSTFGTLYGGKTAIGYAVQPLYGSGGFASSVSYPYARSALMLDTGNSSGAFTFYGAATTTTAIGTALTLTGYLSGELGRTLALQGASPVTGTGVSFPATQSASSDANTLDDYEEGSWTPRIYKNGVEVTSPTSAFGRYIKIGQSVWIHFYFYKSSGSASGGNWSVENLPFTVGTASYQVIPVGYNEVNGTQSTGILRWQPTASTTTLYLYKDGGLLGTDWSTSFIEFAATGTYQASA